MPYHIPLTSADLGTGVVNFLIAFTRPYFMSDSDTDAWGRSSRGPHKFMTLLAISGINLGWSAYKTFFSNINAHVARVVSFIFILFTKSGSNIDNDNSNRKLNYTLQFAPAFLNFQRRLQTQASSASFVLHFAISLSRETGQKSADDFINIIDYIALPHRLLLHDIRFINFRCASCIIRDYEHLAR